MCLNLSPPPPPLLLLVICNASPDNTAAEAYKDMVRRFLGEQDSLPLRFTTYEPPSFFQRVFGGTGGGGKK